jgi:hypothetical protein
VFGGEEGESGTEFCVKERPILFSASMVKAILDDRKSQTRRLVTPGTSEIGSGPFAWSRLDFSDAFVDPGGTEIFGPGPYLKVKRPDDDTRHRVYPRYEVGMRLWVKETWAPADLRYSIVPIVYRADGDAQPCLDERWRPSIFMRRPDSRITLEITKVRCERVQEISEEDARGEGVLQTGGRADLKPEHFRPARDLFRELWDKINRKRAPWSSNPWVWVLEFRKVEAERRAAE